MRCIDADALEELFREVIGGIAKQPEMSGSLEHMVRASAMVIEMIRDAPTIEPEPHWHECFEDDPSTFPDNDRNVIVTFSNFSLPIIGQWRYDPDEGGCWYLGDTDETFVSKGLFVDGWWELPKKPYREEGEK